ncbi:MAG: thiamine phosphate synthase [Dehalococcoidia bacterium]|nr:thiamine phosphate synthase [Dehalococcoidia bacterium]
MSDSQVNRIIDANLNRAGEGLRVLEETARFVLNDAVTSARVKELRHQVSLHDLQTKLKCLSARDAACDVGEDIKTSFQTMPRELTEIAVANARRAEEALRVLEELASQTSLNAQVYASARYELYTLEKEIIGRLSRRDKTQRIRGLLAIIDTVQLKRQSILESTAQMLDCGAKIIQLRGGATCKGELLHLAHEMQKLCAAHNALFIVNTHLDIALASNADGLHIEHNDMPLIEARRIMPLDKIIGCSVGTHAEAYSAERDGADYILCQNMSAELMQDTVSPNLIKHIKQAVKLPLMALSQIGLQAINISLEAGAEVVALNSAEVQLNLSDARELVQMINSYSCQA